MMESTLPYFFSNFFTSIPDSNTNFQLFDHHLASSSLVGLGKNETLVLKVYKSTTLAKKILSSNKSSSKCF